MIRTIALSLLLAPSFLLADVIDDLIVDIEAMPRCRTKAELVERYRDLLSPKFAAAERTMCRQAEISLQEYARRKTDFFGGPPPEGRELAAGTWLHDRCMAVINDFGVPVSKIICIGNKTSEASVMLVANEGYYLMLNEHALNTFPAHDVEGTIAHELQHVIFDDNRSSTIARSLGKTFAFSTWSKLKEVRADIFAALHNMRYADGLYEGFLRYNIDTPVSCFRQHPSYAQRIRIFGLIRQQLDALHNKNQNEKYNAKQNSSKRPFSVPRPRITFKYMVKALLAFVGLYLVVNNLSQADASNPTAHAGT